MSYTKPFSFSPIPNVEIQSVQNNDILSYNQSSGSWTNRPLPTVSNTVTTTGTGIYASGDGSSLSPLTFLPINVNDPITGDGTSASPINFTWPITSKGDLITYDTTVDRLAVGSNGQALVPNSSSPTGLAWQNPGDGTSISSTFPLSFLGVQADAPISGTGTSSSHLTFTWPITTKGDIQTFSNSPSRLAVGTNGQALTPNTSATNGLQWENPGDGTTLSTTFPLSFLGVVVSAPLSGLGTSASHLTFTWPITTKGDLQTFDTSPTRLAVGTNGQTLTPNSSASTGLQWENPGDGTTITSTFPLSVIAPNNFSHYCYVTPGTYGSATAFTTSASTGVWTTMQMSGGTSTGNQFANDGSFNTSTNTWTCPSTGFYFLSCGVGCATGINATFSWSFGFAQNSVSPYGAYLGYIQTYTQAPSGSANSYNNTSTCAFINSGTTIKVQAWQNSGTTVSFIGLYFCAARIN